MRKAIVICCILLISCVFLSCAGDDAAEIYENAQFEELQNNNEHALQLYRKVVNEHPESTYAEKAREKLLALEDR